MKENFQVGKPVKGPEFIGRDKEKNELVNLIKTGQSVVLIAPRRFGKTSLIISVLEQLEKQGFDTSYVDIFTTPDINRFSEIFTHNILENRKLGKILTLAKKNVTEIFKNVELKAAVEDFEFVLKFGQAVTDSWTLLEESLEFADKFSQKYKTSLVVGLDEFGDLEKLGGDELAKLFRSKMQIQEKVCYIFSGSYESVMNQLFTTSKSPFYRFARIIQLGYIEKKEFRKLFITKLAGENIQVNDNLIDKILSFTGGHPYYSSLFLQQWLLMKELPESTEDAFHYLTDIILNIEIPYLEKLWEEVSSNRDQRGLILALAEDKKPYSFADVKRINVSRVINALKNKGFILKGKEGYYFSDPLFALWLRREVLKDI